jgi:ABC-2 type transport system permease protein
MRKAWEITLKDLRVTFGDTNLLLMMFAAPLALAGIIAVTFGGVMGNSSPINHIKVAVVNLDEGASLGLGTGGDSLNYGEIMTNLLVTGTTVEGSTPELEGQSSFNIGGVDTASFTCPEAETSASAGTMGGDSLDTLIDGTLFATPEEARTAVTSGDFAAAVIIPASFSADLQVTPTDAQMTPTTIELYTSPVSPIGAQIVRSVVDQISAQFAAGNVTLSALISSLPSNPLQIASVVASPAFSEGIACAFAGIGSSIAVERQTVGGDEVAVNALVVIGAAQALFFAIFTANGQAGSIIAERRDGTLNRMLVTPTPRIIVLLGKVMSIFIVVLVQVTLLCLALTVLASLLSSTPTFIWGTNIPGVIAVIVATSLAVSGLGAITAAVAKNEEQANTIGTVLALFMAVVGGSFGFALPGPVANLSIVKWGTDAFARIAAGNNDILLNLVILAAFGVVTFGIGFVLFRSKITDR